MDSFDYREAFARNIGWLTPDEQAVLGSKQVAIAGLGGVGGSHLMTLARLGIGRFHVADLDHFELANFNRQAGASVHNLGREKVEVLAEMALAVNPELVIGRFPAGVDEDNVGEFLSGVDLFVDGLDFFALEARRLVFAACASLGIPAVTAAPLGMGAAVLTFLPGRMSFEDYFCLEGLPEEEQLVRFLLGLSPAMLQRGYLVEPGAVDLAAHRGPSTAMACELCSGLAATEALKILLRRGRVIAAPRGLQLDAYRNRLVKTWRPGGNRNPVQRLGLAIARRQLARIRDAGKDHAPPVETGARAILELARWAPSGDNTQPWRFELKGERHVVVHGHDTRDHCVYDLRGHASQIALGALLETLTLAATPLGLRTEVSRREEMPDNQPTFDVRWAPEAGVEPDSLVPYIKLRATQRRAMRTRALRGAEKRALEAAVSPSYSVLWLEGFAKRLEVARFLFDSAGLRLTLREAFEVHRSIIEWGATFSEDRIPERAVGLDPLMSRITRWALGDWRRIELMNTYFAGTLAPRVLLDFIPALSCAAHALIVAPSPPFSTDDFVSAGRAVQRFWLSATRLGLWQQPEMTPLIFSAYARDGVRFSESEAHRHRAERLATRLDALATPELARRAVWMGRLGAGPAPKSRSLRLPLDRLLVDGGSQGAPAHHERHAEREESSERPAESDPAEPVSVSIANHGAQARGGAE